MPKHPQSVSFDPAYSQLRNGVWFGSLAPSLAHALFSGGRSETYDAGEYIYHEGRPSQGLFGLVEGAVHFEKNDPGGHRLLVHVAGPGFWFGEVAATGAHRTAVCARAFASSRVWRIPVHALTQALSAEPELFGALSALMAGRFSALIELITTLHKPTAIAQVAGRLAILDRYCKESDTAVEISTLRMTQSDLADMTGHVRQTVNSAIKKLELDGLIKVGHRQIEILDPAQLTAYAGGD